jgi:hypothetical protein
MSGRIRIFTLACLVMVGALVFYTLAGAQATKPLNEEGIVKLIELQLPDEAIVAKLRKDSVTFVTDDTIVERLKKAGASDTVIAAVREVGRARPAAGRDAPNAVTYKDILELLKLGIDEPTILARLEKSITIFTLDAGQVEELKGAGATEKLLDAMQGRLSKPAAGGEVTDVAIILDCSASMNERTKDGKTKMDVARQVVSDLIKYIPNELRLAFVVYGQNRSGCEAVEVIRQLSPLDNVGRNILLEKIRKVPALGSTPIALALQTAGKELAKAKGPCGLVLISDGKETCKGNPAAETARLSRDLNLSFGLNVIGFDVQADEREALEEMARLGKGKYYNAANAAEFRTVVAALHKNITEAVPKRKPTPEGYWEAVSGRVVGKHLRIRKDADRFSGDQSIGGGDPAAFLKRDLVLQPTPNPLVFKGTWGRRTLPDMKQVGIDDVTATLSDNGERLTVDLPDNANVVVLKRIVAEAFPQEDPNPLEESFQRLFNGNDLTGWSVDTGDPNDWRVENHEIVVDGQPARRGWLLSDRNYSDFILRFEFKMSEGANSGLALRAQSGENYSLRQISQVLEVQLSDDFHLDKYALGPNRSCGALCSLVIDRPAVLKPVGSWNEMQVEARGRLVRVAVNGREVLSTDLARFSDRAEQYPGLLRRSGRIGFQNLNGQVRFRNIEIKELSGSAARRGPFIEVAKASVAKASTSNRRAIRVLKPQIDMPPMKSIIATKAGSSPPGFTDYAPIQEITKYGVEIRIPTEEEFDVLWLPQEGIPVWMIRKMAIKERRVVELKPEDHLGLVVFNGTGLEEPRLIALHPPGGHGPSFTDWNPGQISNAFGKLMVVPPGTYDIWVITKEGGRASVVEKKINVEAGKITKID